MVWAFPVCLLLLLVGVEWVLLFLFGRLVRARRVTWLRAFPVAVLWQVLGLLLIPLSLHPKPWAADLAIDLFLLAVCVEVLRLAFQAGWLRALGVSGLTIAVNLLIGLGLRAWTLESFVLAGHSMAPALLPGDRVLVDKVIYRFRPPRRGEVVVYRPPHREGLQWIHRIAAVPGDRVEVRAGLLCVNGRSVCRWDPLEDESPRGPGPDDVNPAGCPPVVPEGKVFTLGDNHRCSLDSRMYGLVDQRDVIGKCRLIYASRGVPERVLAERGWRPARPGDIPGPQGIRWNRFARVLP